MKKIIIIVLFVLGTSFCAHAQTEATTPDTNVVVIENVMIYKDPRLDVLDKRGGLIAKIEADEKAREVPVYAPIVSANGKKKVTGSIYTAKGFRVVIYNGPDRAMALASKNAFMRAFPGTPSYMSYNVPSYKIKVGNFPDRADATKFLRMLSKAFPTSFIVPDIVTIKNINVTN
ncbi:MAG: SPOR domain-containing protein [Chitinophagaceae bacterium]|nr:SPOR domain-containing protein [Chitinophagaceae bacterium]